MTASPQLAVYSSTEPASRTVEAERALQELWFTLVRGGWISVALVPGDTGDSTAELATALASVGRRLRAEPVMAIVADPVDYGSAGRIAAAIDGRREGAPLQVIAAIPPVVAEPLGVAVAHAAEAAVVCVRMGRTRLASVRRTVELIGRDRVAGCVLVE